jgi:hypothetical protein
VTDKLRQNLGENCIGSVVRSDFRTFVLVFVSAITANTMLQRNGALHTNSEQFHSDSMARNGVCLLQRNTTQNAFGTFHCCEHFSLAKAFLLAIMCVQLGNVWGVYSNDQLGTPTL